MEKAASSIMNTTKQRKLGLYIHIPFCAKKCDYCDFLSAPAGREQIRDYFEALITEVQQYRGRTDSYIISTIFIGGGTPSYVDSSYIEAVMNAVKEVFQLDHHQLEATIEINPGTVTREKLKTYQRIGINRLSFGLQSSDNNELKLLGRIHTFEQFEENYNLARELGFKNINIDLMSALPGQTLRSWEDTLYKVIALQPEHISAYSLIIEEGTKFYERYKEGAKLSPTLPDEDTDRFIYYKTKEILHAHGYHRYEISNYAKDAFECKHNSSYWIGTEYLGIGLGASSLLDSARFANLHNINQYIDLCNEHRFMQRDLETCLEEKQELRDTMVDCIGLRTDFEILAKKQRMEEFMFLGLRMCKGISKSGFFSRFGVDINSVYGEILLRLYNENLLEYEGDNLRLTDYGMDISNYVFSQFLLED